NTNMKNILLSKLPIVSGVVLFLLLSAGRLYAQTGAKISITGKVSDDNDNTPLIGATIAEKGTNNGTTSDAEGNYKISVSPGASIVASFIGYVSQEIDVDNLSIINLSLKADQQQLQDVVVVGYGTQRKKDLTGSIAKVSAEQFIQPSVGSFDQMLQGKAPGVQISQTTGAPGGNVNMLIRGISSITGGNQPLYVIDGFAMGTGGGGSDMRSYGENSFSSAGMANNTGNRVNPLASINPSDIESIEILKDASATAIYGSRGANGVVIITTKRGSYGKSQISVDTSYGIQEVANKLEMLNSKQYAEYLADGRDNAWVYASRTGKITDANEVRSAATKVRPEFRNPESIATDTDWQDVLFRTAPVRNVQVSATDGNEKAKYFISGGYFSQEGVIINSYYNRFNLRVNVDAQIAKWIKIGSSTFGSYGFGRFANTES
ncbi:MAG: SusC/RagA family TonB-linked outer membrane protein, partial [Candidatus Nephrothrix sp. EaCA]